MLLYVNRTKKKKKSNQDKESDASAAQPKGIKMQEKEKNNIKEIPNLGLQNK